jgi:photosystem II stability/assembly factor-like uncharacterized protein
MRTVLLLCTVVVACIVPAAQAQNVWARLNPQPYGAESNTTLTEINHLAVAPNGTLWYFVGGYGALFSTNGGASFTRTNYNPQLSGFMGGAWSSHFTSGGRMYVGTQVDGVFHTDDTGASWFSYAPKPADWVMGITTTASGRLLVATKSGIYSLGPVVIGVGYTWPKMQNGNFNDILTLPTGEVIAVGEAGIYRSADEGTTWAKTSTEVRIYTAVAVTAQGTMLVNSDLRCPTFNSGVNCIGGIYRSTDRGQTWTTSNAGLVPGPGTIAPGVDVVATPTEIFAAIESGGVFRSTNDGQSWSRYATGLPTFFDSYIPKLITASASGEVYVYARGLGSTLPGLYKRVGGTTARETEAGNALQVLENHPNPFDGATTIRFTLPVAAPVLLRVYDARGAEVATLAQGPMAAGAHEVTWNAEGLPNGLYLARLTAGPLMQTCTLVRTR